MYLELDWLKVKHIRTPKLNSSFILAVWHQIKGLNISKGGKFNFANSKVV